MREYQSGRVREAENIAQAYLFLMAEAFAIGSIRTVDGGPYRPDQGRPSRAVPA